MSLLPPIAKHIGQIWVDPITAERFEWDGDDWRGVGANPDWPKVPHRPIRPGEGEDA